MGQERGPRYVNNVAVFVKKGQKDIDANEHLGHEHLLWMPRVVCWQSPELHAAAQGGSSGEERCALLRFLMLIQVSFFRTAALPRKKRRPKKPRRKKINKRHK